MYRLIFPLWCRGKSRGAALSSAIQHALSPDFGEKQGMECLNTRFLQPTLMCAKYNVHVVVKSKKKKKIQVFKYAIKYKFNCIDKQVN